MKQEYLSVTRKTRELLLWLSTFKAVYLVLFCVFADIIVSFIFSLLFQGSPDVLSSFQPLERFLLSVILGPLIETFFFQHFILRLSMRGLNKNEFIAILFSATLFGLSHYYSAPYIFKTFFSGILFGLLYFSIAGKKRNPFLHVMIAHSLYNFIGYLLYVADSFG